MKSFIFTLFFFIFIGNIFTQNHTLYSPSGTLRIDIETGMETHFSVFHQDKKIIDQATISMLLNNIRIPIFWATILNTDTRSVDEYSQVTIPVKSKTAHDLYNELIITFEGDYSLTFRAYNNGIAYQFSTSMNKSIEVYNEQFDFSFADDCLTYFPEESSLISHYERVYHESKISAIENNKFCSLPVLFQNDDGINVLVTEAELFDYPGLFLEKSNDGFISLFPKVILESIPAERGADRNINITKEADYIAITDGTRSFPWRVFIIEENDQNLLTNNLVYQLSSSCKLKNTNWIKPGKVAWDWWNANNIYGVDFEAGINTDTYKYYIDFASEFGLEYIILDEGWSKSTTDLMHNNTDINVEELVKYAKERNVELILWVLWEPLNKDMKKVLDLYSQWGVAGIKVDFMQRADQEMVNFYELVAKEAAERELIVDFHGAFKPSGLRKSYPNVLNYEGLKGLENCKWGDLISPHHDLLLPFIRMVSGPMDYTPGAMNNAHAENFSPIWNRPMSQGTRCHQVAMYVVYDSPLQMLCDNPSNYYKEKETTNYISQIPTTWDTTIALEAQIGSHLLMARKNQDRWYVGALNNENQKTIDLKLDFLDEGEYIMEWMEDGKNANRMAEDYKQSRKVVKSKEIISITMASGGGWTGIFRKIESK